MILCALISFKGTLIYQSRSSHPQMFFKMDILKYFRNIHRKTTVLDSLFNKIAGLQACNFSKKSLQHRCFPVNNEEFLKTTFFIEHLRWLHLNVITSVYKVVKDHQKYHVRSSSSGVIKIWKVLKHG